MSADLTQNPDPLNLDVEDNETEKQFDTTMRVHPEPETKFKPEEAISAEAGGRAGGEARSQAQQDADFDTYTHSINPPKPIRIDIDDPRYKVTGMDVIWHNMYAYPTPSDYAPTPPMPAADDPNHSVKQFYATTHRPRRDTPEPEQYVKRPFKGFRGWMNATPGELVQLVAKHVEKGMYDVISLNVGRHSASVIVGTTKGWDDFGEAPFYIEHV